jgi:hypothetical protein
MTSQHDLSKEERLDMLSTYTCKTAFFLIPPVNQDFESTSKERNFFQK